MSGEWADGENAEYAQEESHEEEPLSYELLKAFVGNCATCERAPNCDGCNHPYARLMPTAIKCLRDEWSKQKLGGEE